MGLLDIFKRNKKEKIINNDNLNNVKSHNNLALRPENIPNEIRELLWFSDGEYKNFNNDNIKKSIFTIDEIKFELSFTGAEEPSLISCSLPIKQPVNLLNIDKPGYYPSYKNLTSEQRWLYLDWLRNIEKEIDISYVFIFYYALERNLFFGEFDKAFNTILRLRRNHKNKSFLAYSSDALVAACLIHNRVDAFIKYMDSINDVDDIAITPIYLIAKKQMNMGLVASEIMKLSRQVGFNNSRYIKDEKVYFEEELNKLLQQRYSIGEMSLEKFNLKRSPEVEQRILANYSIPSEKSIIKIRNIIDNQLFSDEVLDLLKESHEGVKERLKNLRKNGDTIIISKVKENIATKKVSEVFKKSPLFEEINVNMFDQNLCLYNKGICPYCNNKLEKIPVSKGKCSSCKCIILVKNSEFTGQKIILTEEQYNEMVRIREERVYRNWVNGMIYNLQISVLDFAKYISKGKISIEQGLLEKYEALAEKEYISSNLGLYRNAIFNKAIVYEKMNEYYNALDLYLLICYYDLLGCSNGTKKFDKEMAFIAPVIVEYIKSYMKKLSLGENEIKSRLVEVIKNSKDKSNINVVNSIWSELREELIS